MSAQAYEAVRSRWGWMPREDRALFRVTGERCVEMIDGLVTNDLKAAPVGRALWALFLTPKGRIVADARVLRREAELLFDTPATAAAALEALLRKYLPPRFARAERRADGSVLGVYGPEAAAALSEVVGRPVPETPGDAVAAGDGSEVAVVRDDLLGLPGCEALGEADALAALARELETRGARIDRETFEALRIEAGLPLYGIDVTEHNLVQETGWEGRAVSYTKGCYVGQEVVIRVHHRGHPNRYLRGLRFHGEPAPAGTALFSAGKPVGTVTSAARSPRLGPLGLAYVRREVEPAASVRVGAPDAGAAAEVVALPFPR